jgi:AraC-like DNA-binding protein
VQVEKGQKPILPVLFRAPTPFGLEVMTFAHLQAIAPPGYLRRLQRPEFHLLIWIQRGQAAHTVDFERYTLAPDHVLWVKPGQVQTFGEYPLPIGQLVLFQPDFLFHGTQAATFADQRFGPAHWQLRHPAITRVGHAFEQLRDAYDGAATGPRSLYGELLKHLLSVLLLRLREASPPDPLASGKRDDTFARLRDAVERDFATHHQVVHYAQTLGYAPRTLSRAALNATGNTAKQLIDRRIILEAERVLAYTDLPITTIADQLGFDDASNFSSFFARHTATSPSAFRTQLAQPDH